MAYDSNCVVINKCIQDFCLQETNPKANESYNEVDNRFYFSFSAIIEILSIALGKNERSSQIVSPSFHTSFSNFLLLP